MGCKRISVPLIVETSQPFRSPQPVTVGIPFARGTLSDKTPLVIQNTLGNAVPVQKSVLGRWPDGSIQWLLLDFILGPQASPGSELLLQTLRQEADSPVPPCVQIEKSSANLTVRTQTTTFAIARSGQFLQRVRLGERGLITAASIHLGATAGRGGTLEFQTTNVSMEESGAVRATVQVEGTCPGIGCEFNLRTSFFAGTSLAKMVLTVRNSNRALHRGGLWDLGDRNSALFEELYLAIELPGAKSPAIDFSPEPGIPSERIAAEEFEIYQDSSGGENWQSRNHVNRENRVPCSFRGYSVRYGDTERTGRRANPTVTLRQGQACISVAVPEFWQQFPKAIEVRNHQLKISLFPRQFDDLHELQGGEQKTHVVWLDFSEAPSGQTEPLDWVHNPASVRALPDWYAGSGAIPSVTSQQMSGGAFDELLDELTNGDDNLIARREIIDEYGWRNFGDIYANHEKAYYTGSARIISHFNNQYDFLAGALTQYLRSGKKCWLDIFDPLARHVMDIDIYHTDRDRSGYNSGLFWHTDHYRDAGTSTHRCYSRANKAPGKPYGGGPGCEQNYSTGLLYYHFLTGSTDARDAVTGLANWVIAMDDGRRSLLGIVDQGSTGFASCTQESSYHGPGRGSGNSINTLLDAWLLSRHRHFLAKAESLIRRSIHPSDDIEGRDLLNVERRWSYTIFLVVLARYLTIKKEDGEIDYMYAYGRVSLLAYAQWMLDNELPYFDQREKLEYPTETWAAHDLRKANVLLIAAGHADDPLRARLRARGHELGERAWNDVFRFESRLVTRSIAVALAEGPRLSFLQTSTDTEPRPAQEYDFGSPEEFLDQRSRVRNRMRSLSGATGVLLSLFNPRNWWRYYFAY
jgi:hypothetical protein